jgi:hypothetical protein
MSEAVSPSPAFLGGGSRSFSDSTQWKLSYDLEISSEAIRSVFFMKTTPDGPSDRFPAHGSGKFSESGKAHSSLVVPDSFVFDSTTAYDIVTDNTHPDDRTFTNPQVSISSDTFPRIDTDSISLLLKKSRSSAGSSAWLFTVAARVTAYVSSEVFISSEDCVESLTLHETGVMGKRVDYLVSDSVNSGRFVSAEIAFSLSDSCDASIPLPQSARFGLSDRISGSTLALAISLFDSRSDLLILFSGLGHFPDSDLRDAFGVAPSSALADSNEIMNSDQFHDTVTFSLREPNVSSVSYSILENSSSLIMILNEIPGQASSPTPQSALLSKSVLISTPLGSEQSPYPFQRSVEVRGGVKTVVSIGVIVGIVLGLILLLALGILIGLYLRRRRTTPNRTGSEMTYETDNHQVLEMNDQGIVFGDGIIDSVDPASAFDFSFENESLDGLAEVMSSNVDESVLGPPLPREV